MWKILALFCFCINSAASEEVGPKLVQVTPFVASPSTTAQYSQHQVLIAARLDIAPGWHVYAPGQEMASEPRFLWDKTASSFALKETIWQRPQVLKTLSGDVNGYEHQAWVCFEGSWSHLQPQTLEADVDVPICDETSCRLERIHVKWTFPPQQSEVLNSADISKIKYDEKGKDFGFTFLLTCLFAFLGGLILNVMPCVLPILSIKILGLLKVSDHPKLLRAHGFSFSLGVCSSVLALASIIWFLRSKGQDFGWGFHLQIPGFVCALICLFFILALNAWHVFYFKAVSVQLSQKFINPLGRTFLEGVLATVVASPCTAPFMGTAIAYGLQAVSWKFWSVFVFLGIGLSTPFLLLCCLPRLINCLPKPGAWMVTLQEVFGFFFMATVLWLSWVFGSQTSLENMLIVWSGLLFIGVAFWAKGKWITFTASSLKRLTGVVIMLVAFGSAALFFHKAMMVQSIDVSWEPFTKERIEQLKKQGKPYFIDFTAQWCLTCKTNKKFVLETSDILKKFAEKGIVLLRGDWTVRDPNISKAISEYGRAGVPLYIFFTGEPYNEIIILPEILTKSQILEVLDKI